MEDLIKKVVEEVLKEAKKIDDSKSNDNLIPIEASAKHVHLSQKDVEALFGAGHQLTFDRELSQPGQFLAKERVMLIGPKGVIERVAVLGPARNQTQVEISITDSRVLGVEAKLRESGQLEGTKGIVISGNGNVVKALNGLIAAKRHIHMTSKDAEKLNVKDKQIVSVKVYSDRPVILEDVVVRVNDNYALAMHIDFDEANACALTKGVKGEIVC